MRRDAAGTLTLSATDLANFLNCRHRTALELGEARGGRRRPAWTDPLLQALFARGLEHERSFIAQLRDEGRTVVDLSDAGERDHVIAATLAAMRAGADVIVQGAVGEGRWYGRPDVLMRVDSPSGLGPWSYEVADTKLALETRAGTILQLGLYCDLLAGLQALIPEHFHVVTPDAVTPVRRYRVDDYAAYFRLLRGRLDAAIDGDEAALALAHYPEPVEHCDVCVWSSVCRQTRRHDDHLSLVAGITRVQRTELATQAIGTMTALGTMPVPLPFKPRRGAKESYVRVREQARLQLEARAAGAPGFELIHPIEADQGLCRLPKPSPGDLFLDLEGDPFVGEDGREYLFGAISLSAANEPIYHARWALSAADEAAAFDALIEQIMTTWAVHPGMHVYHYAPYEPAALKRMMGRFAQRESAIDSLLRAGRFVDLYAVVRQGVRAGVERYSIKSLEPLYAFTRQVPLLDANRGLRVMEQALELGRTELITRSVIDTIQGYNEDDCVSALRLRDWLESLRRGLETEGQVVPRPQRKADEVSSHVTDREQRVAALRARLLEGVDDDATKRDAGQQASWLMAYLLDWHRREDKAGWWDYFRLRDLAEDDLFDEPRAIAGLEFVERVDKILGKHGRPTGSVVDRYRYPAQEMEVRRGDELKLRTEKKFGEVIHVDRAAHTIEIRKGPTLADTHPASVFEHRYINADVIEDAIFAIGETVASGDADPLALRLLRGDAPSTRSGTFEPRATETAVDFAVRVGGDLAQTVLAIQGPPGAGKTFTGAQMICRLVAQGQRVGVIATGHTVIRHLLTAVAEAANRLGLTGVVPGHKVEEAKAPPGPIVELEGNAAACEAIQSGAVNVLGGTAWLWSRPEFAGAVDVLFVDEAGQMSLANVLAATRAARSVVLLGDPRQLEQPKKGTHPEGVGVSVLQHMLGPHATVPPGRGIFLPETWRLAPGIAAFTSEAFYEGRLRSKPGLDRQRLAGNAFASSALWAIDVNHDGNRNASDEEVDVVDGLVSTLLAAGSVWIDETGRESQLAGRDILVVAPFNAQVGRLAERLALRGVATGTVDKFQGQEAPVVIYSMATSSPDEAPRGLEFLYSLNRLNVATSRARCAVFVVANPRLYAPDCRTPRQIALASALCRFRELASIVPADVENARPAST